MPASSSVEPVAARRRALTPVRSGEAATLAENAPARAQTLAHAGSVAGVAALAAAVGVAAYSPHAEAVVAAGFAAVLVILAAFDLQQGRIPNRIVLPAAGIVLAAQIALLPDRAGTFVIAAGGAAVAFLIPNLLSNRLMGMGDVKLALLIGAGLGWAVVGAVIVAFLAAFPFAVVSLVRRGWTRGATLPFGPFLAFGSILVLAVPRLLGLGV
jgi:leader peptidase (prepilin peptidase)/N-methyltransferase